MSTISNTELAATIDNTAVKMGALATALNSTDLGDQFDVQICQGFVGSDQHAQRNGNLAEHGTRKSRTLFLLWALRFGGPRLAWACYKGGKN